MGSSLALVFAGICILVGMILCVVTLTSASTRQSENAQSNNRRQSPSQDNSELFSPIHTYNSPARNQPSENTRFSNVSSSLQLPIAGTETSTTDATNNAETPPPSYHGLFGTSNLENPAASINNTSSSFQSTNYLPYPNTGTSYQAPSTAPSDST